MVVGVAPLRQQHSRAGGEKRWATEGEVRIAMEEVGRWLEGHGHMERADGLWWLLKEVVNGKEWTVVEGGMGVQHMTGK